MDDLCDGMSGTAVIIMLLLIVIVAICIAVYDHNHKEYVLANCKYINSERVLVIEKDDDSFTKKRYYMIQKHYVCPDGENETLEEKE